MQTMKGCLDPPPWTPPFQPRGQGNCHNHLPGFPILPFCAVRCACVRAHVCSVHMCTCDKQELLTSAPGVFRGPLKLRV